MAQKEEEMKNAPPGGANEFAALFEESLRTVKPGGVVKGTSATSLRDKYL